MIEQTKEILQQAEMLYNSVAISENALGNSTNKIFEMATQETPIILRVSDYSENKKSHVDFELNWLNYLSEGMRQVVRPVLSKNENLYEIVKIDKKSYILCAFEKASGKPVNTSNLNEWNDTLFESLGKIMGKMHSLTKQYSIDKELIKRYEWYNDTIFLPEYDFTNDDEINQRWNQITSELHKLPRLKESYGIIHNDLHHLNFYIDGGEITVFDFDDCICSWYTFDIMLTMYHVVSTIPYEQGNERNQFAQRFILAFLQGYLRYNSIEKHWVDYFDLFLKYRRISTYKFIKYLFGKRPDNPYNKYCKWLRSEILQDNQFVSLDLSKIQSLLG